MAKQTKYGDVWIEKYLREKADEAGTELFRVACKMATGSGKTVVMSMLIAWQVLNKRRYPRDNRFTDAFLVVAPGITIRDRLRVLLPSDPNNYYRELDIVPSEHRADLGHGADRHHQFPRFQAPREGRRGRSDQAHPHGQLAGAFTESPDEMVNRVCNDLGKHREIIGHQRRGAPLLPRQGRTRPRRS